LYARQKNGSLYANKMVN